MLAGDEKWDAEKLTKSATKIWGQAAADATNAAMMLAAARRAGRRRRGGASP